MCGIVGIAGTADVAPQIALALKRLEYRGYDSAGIATLVDGHIERRRSPGKLSQLDAVLAKTPLAGITGIGHTRWATHGKPTEANAHPHASARVAIVHNGIIENFRELRAELQAKGHTFESETDSEVCAHLVTEYLAQGLTPKDAALAATRRLTGAFSLAMIFDGHEGLLIGARKGAPLAAGYGETEGYLGSDAFALAPFTNRVAYLEDGDVVVIEGPQISIYDSEGRPANREVTITSASAGLVDKAGYRHFMMKEIHEQPEVIGHTLTHYLDPTNLVTAIAEPKAVEALKAATRLTISACGTAFYAGQIGKYWFEKIARLAVEADVASELRYRDPVYPRRRRRAVHFTIRRDGRHAGGPARCQGARPDHAWRWSTSPKAPSPAKPISCCRPLPARRSAWPRPRRSPVSLRRWPRWRLRPARRAAPSTGRASRR